MGLFRSQPGNISKVIAVNFCTRFHLYIHVYALYLQDRGLSLVQISIIESVVIGTIFLAEVPTGVLADRVGRKWSVMLSTLLLMLAEALFLVSRSYPLYLVVGVLTGVGFAFASGAVESLIYDSLPARNRDHAMKRAMGRLNSLGQIAFFIAPVVGGLVVGDLSTQRVQLAIGLTVITLLIGVLISLTIKEPPTAWQAERSSARAILANGLTEIRASRRLQHLTLLAIFTTPFTGMLIGTLAPTYMTHNAVPPFLIGVGLSLGSLLAALTQHNAHRVEQALGARRAILLLTLLPGVMYGLLALLTGPLAVWLLITLMYGTNDLRHPLFSAYQNALISSRSRATVLSLMNMGQNLFVALIAPLYAAVASLSLPLAFALMGVVIVAAGVLLRADKLAAGVKSDSDPAHEEGL
jgi:MFS family permease